MVSQSETNTSLFICSPSFQIPQIFHSLQGSVQAVLLGGVVESDWTNQGVPARSMIESWPLQLNSDPKNTSNDGSVRPCITGDGRYLYLHGSCGLLKIGTGYGNTERVRYFNNWGLVFAELE